MKNNDVELLQRIIGGDEAAFTELVKKYQKQVHTLTWRKIGDFHIAEEITQEAFLKVYQKLHTLKNLNQFSGWLYVITTNLCATWRRKKRIQTEPFEDVTEPLEDEAVEAPALQADAYSEYVVEEQSKIAGEAQREVVKKLLAKLKESERTVMMLHYYGEMTCEEISRFLGVSTGTIKSRLQRARQRLQKEETMIRAALEHFQISPNLTDNIMREVARLKPTAPSGSKPLVPWTIAASSMVLIVLILGIGSQHLTHFQQPYSLEAQAETTVELVDAPIVLNIDAKPNGQRELGNLNALGQDESNGQKSDELLFGALSGRVVDESGAPIEGVNVYLLADFHEVMVQQLFPWMFAEVVNRVPTANAPDAAAPYTQFVSKTDKTGAFAFPNVVSQPVMSLGITPPGQIPDHDYEFIRFEIGEFTFQNQDPSWVPFSISPDTTVQDIEVTVRHQRGIRVQVVTADGAPLKNTTVNVKTKHFFDHGFAATAERNVLLNDRGRFTEKIYRNGIHAINVKHNDLTAESAPLEIEMDQRAEVVLKLLPEVEQQKIKTLSDAAVSEIQQLIAEGVWVINPKNRHAYKRIQIKTLEEARQKAEAQGAYLVAINDAAEQHYLLEVLGVPHASVNNFWIGLKPGATHWDSGEPVTFTKLFTPTQSTDTEKVNEAKPEKDGANVLLWGKHGVWTVEHQGTPSTEYVIYAILEKENLIVGMPKPDDATEKR